MSNTEIIVIGGDDEPSVTPEHEAQMEAVAEVAQEALAVAEVALAAAATDEGHVCRCGEIEARVIALETAAVIEDEEEAEMDAALAVAIEAAATEPVEEAVMPEPPVKETPPAEVEAEEKPSKAKRGGVSKGWFGSRAR